MKFSIKRKLLYSFIIVIIVPALVTLFLLVVNSYQYNNNSLVKEFKKIEKLQINIVNELKENPSILNDNEALSQFIESNIKNHDINVQVTDELDNVLYNSNSINYNNKRVYSYTKTNFLVVNNKTIATLTFFSDADFRSVIIKFNQNNMVIFIIGFLTLFGSVFASIIYLSKSILVPLNELQIAANNIVKGNLNYQIKYNKRDELGDFCNTFDSMRVKLKDLLEKQALYEQSRKEMIASISHDLRTPISSIKGYVEGLQDGIVNKKEDIDLYLTVIKSKSEKLDLLIDDLFQFSKLELNRLDMYMKTENSAELLSDIFKEIEFELSKDEIEFVIKKPLPNVPIYVDKNRISQVLDNLIHNSQNYVNENGKIVIGSIINDDHLQIYVQDNGTGITQEDLPYIFDRFFRGEKSRSRKYGGTGLGLAICKHIIEAHNGKIWVESEVNSGSIFYFEIPIK